MDKPVVFINWDGVLSDRLLWHSFIDGSPKERYIGERIKLEMFGKQDAYVEAWKLGEVTSETFVHDVAELIGEDERVLWYRFVEDCKTMGYADLAYLDAIAELKKTARVVLATDKGEHFRRFIVPHLGLDQVFDDILISTERKYFKKNPEFFFELYLDSIHAHRALIVDDTERVCQGFTELGGVAIHVNREMSTHHALSDAARWARTLSYGS